MKTEEYSRYVEETSKLTLNGVAEEIRKIRDPSLEAFTEAYFRERMFRPWAQRCNVMRASYEAVAPNRNWQEIIDSLIGIELWFMADHLTNDVFDRKYSRNRELTSRFGIDPNMYFIASAISREAAEKCFRECAKKVNPKKEREVIETFNRIVEEAYLHQWLDYYDLKTNKICFDESKARIGDIFKRRYIDYEAGNQFGKITKLSAIFADASEQETNAIENYGKILSTTIQLTNDIADLGDEWFYDRRNGILTLPLIAVSLEVGKYCYDISQKQIRKIYVEKGLFKEHKKLIIKYVNDAKKYLRKVFPKERRAVLEALLVSSTSNRFYKLLPQYDKFYKVMPPQIESKKCQHNLKKH